MRTEQKICKECGQSFEPRNPRQVYCTRDHYRPCPSCGKQVLIKYLSDPTPRCAECRSASKAKPRNVFHIEFEPDPPSKQQPAEEIKQDPDDIIVPKGPVSVLRYIGNPHTNYFTPGHEYEVTITRSDTVYWVTSTIDLTEDKEVSLAAPFSSKISIDRNFTSS